MASEANGDDTAGVDIAHLTPEQQAALEQYTTVTGQAVHEAINLLRRSQWNVQIAITKFFDGDTADPVAEALAQQDHIPAQAPRHENLQEQLLAGSLGVGIGRHAQRGGGARPDPAPRIVPQPQDSTPRRTPFLLAVIFAPFNFGLRAVSTLFRTLMYVFTFLPASVRPRAITTGMTQGFRGTVGRRMLMPRDTAARFKREFEEEYGTDVLPWHEGGFAQALDLAKKELKFLLIVLMSPEHDDTESFTRDTLLSPEVASFITDPANDIVLWGGNVLDSEAYQVASEYNCTKYPFSCIVCLTPKEGSTRMSIVKRLAGPLSPATYLSELQTAINKYAPDLAGVRAERTAQQVSRNLRTEQDDAYERSLARDRERARQRKEAEAAAAAAEQKAEEDAKAARLHEAKKQQWRRWRATTVKPERDASVKDGVVRLALMLPDAGRIVRRFDAETTVEELYAFVECYDILTTNPEVMKGEEEVELPAEKPEDYVHDYLFRIASPLPRVVYDPAETKSLGESIGRSGNLIVEALRGDVEDEEEGEVGGMDEKVGL